MGGAEPGTETLLLLLWPHTYSEMVSDIVLTQRTLNLLRFAEAVFVSELKTRQVVPSRRLFLQQRDDGPVAEEQLIKKHAAEDSRPSTTDCTSAPSN